MRRRTPNAPPVRCAHQTPTKRSTATRSTTPFACRAPTAAAPGSTTNHRAGPASKTPFAGYARAAPRGPSPPPHAAGTIRRRAGTAAPAVPLPVTGSRRATAPTTECASRALWPSPDTSRWGRAPHRRTPNSCRAPRAHWGSTPREHAERPRTRPARPAQSATRSSTTSMTQTGGSPKPSPRPLRRRNVTSSTTRCASSVRGKPLQEVT